MGIVGDMTPLEVLAAVVLAQGGALDITPEQLERGRGRSVDFIRFPALRNDVRIAVEGA